MAGFSGFTEEEIRRFKMQGETVDCGEKVKQEPVKKAAINPAGKRSKPREKVRSRSSNSKANGRPSKEVSDGGELKKEIKLDAMEIKQNETVLEESKVEEKPHEVQVVMEPEKVKELEMTNLEKMQQKQKEMEMVNKKKEKMLQTALKQRYAKTKKETETLKLVQKELSRLDNLLYTDVQILRDKIDHACREFDAARKRYDRAEAEFVNAKVNLHEKTETKDQLTEHLCSIIQQNEERKAKKLAELMARLEMADQETDLEVTDSTSEHLKQKLPDTKTVAIDDQTVEELDEKILSESGNKSNILPESDNKRDIENNNGNSQKEQNTAKVNEQDLIQDTSGKA